MNEALKKLSKGTKLKYFLMNIHLQQGAEMLLILIPLYSILRMLNLLDHPLM